MGSTNTAAEAAALSAKILVVDDRQDKLLALQSILQDLQQDIFTARSGDEALKLVLEHDFAVILLDVNMPGLDGLETAALIRQRKKSALIPIIFITAYSDEMLAMQGYSLGAVDYILSPVVPDILRTKVKVFVDLFCLTLSAKQRAEESIALAAAQAARAAAEEANRRALLLAEASKILTGAPDFVARVQDLFALVIPSLADLCSFTSVDYRGRVNRTQLAWRDSGGTPVNFSTNTLPSALAPVVEKALHRRKAQALEAADSAPAPRESDRENGSGLTEDLPRISSAAIFPLASRDRIVGVLCFALCRGDRTFSPSDWSLLEDLANRAAVALDNALLYQELQTADHRKNEFLAMLGHELRNPLASVLNAVGLLHVPRVEPERLALAHEIIERQVKHLTRLVDDLLDISRITRGKIELRPSLVEVGEAVSTAVDSNMPLIESRKHRLTVSKLPQPLWVKADSARLAQILGNLLNNAAKYTPQGGSIALTIDRDDTDVVFRVIDNGVGFSENMLSNIFDLFAQDERASDSFHQGLGVGLNLANHLVELHGGSITAYSAGPDKGSEFTVRIPISTANGVVQDKTTPNISPVPASKAARVLIVDDNEDAADTTAMLLEDAGFEALAVYDGAAALEKVKDFHPHAVLLDIGMPIMDGYEVVQRLRAQPSGDLMTIVAISGYGQKEDQRRSLEAGFDRHITKPLNPPKLIEILKSLCSDEKKQGGHPPAG